jgi:hypothetical protein
VILSAVLLVASLTLSQLSFATYFWYLVLAVALSASVLGILVVAGESVHSLVSYQLSKLSLSAHSGDTRLWYAQQSLEILRQRPLLGVGVGSHTSPVMFTTVAAESGLLGLATLVGLKSNVFLQAVRRARIDTMAIAGIALVVGGTTLVTTQFLVHPVGALQQPWYWAALALPLAFVAGDTETA